MSSTNTTAPASPTPQQAWDYLSAATQPSALALHTRESLWRVEIALRVLKPADKPAPNPAPNPAQN